MIGHKPMGLVSVNVIGKSFIKSALSFSFRHKSLQLRQQDETILCNALGTYSVIDTETHGASMQRVPVPNTGMSRHCGSTSVLIMHVSPALL